MKNDLILTEHTTIGNVSYTRDESIAIKHSWVKFSYYTVCIQEGINKEYSLVNIIYTKNVNSFNALLAKWNRIGYLYSEVHWMFIPT